MSKLNSLQNLVNTVDEKLNEIRLSISHPNNSDKAFILLEGDDDVKLFRKLLIRDNVDITALIGKSGVIKVIEKLNIEGFSKKIVGICDADFDHLNSGNNYPENLFITDYHDMEVQMIESNNLSGIVAELSSDICHKQLKTDIYNIALEVGYVRWFNHNSNGNLNFKGLQFDQFIQNNQNNIIFSFDNFLTKLLERSENHKTSISSLKSESQKLTKDTNSKLQICNGHDLTKIIVAILNKQYKYKNVEALLRAAYGLNYFKDTQLFIDLENWASSGNFTIFTQPN